MPEYCRELEMAARPEPGQMLVLVRLRNGFMGFVAQNDSQVPVPLTCGTKLKIPSIAELASARWGIEGEIGTFHWQQVPPHEWMDWIEFPNGRKCPLEHLSLGIHVEVLAES